MRVYMSSQSVNIRFAAARAAGSFLRHCLLATSFVTSVAFAAFRKASFHAPDRVAASMRIS